MATGIWRDAARDIVNVEYESGPEIEMSTADYIDRAYQPLVDALPDLEAWKANHP